jgi:hypothetical protein
MYKNINKFFNIFFRKSEFLISWGALLFALFAIFRSIQVSNYINALFGFFLLICMLIYFLIKNHDICQSEISPFSTTIGKINNTIFISLYILCIFSLYFHSIPFERPILFFILYICMISLVLMQIFLGDNNYLIILSKIIFLVLFYILTQALLFDSLMSIDSYYHLFITNMIINNGSVADFGTGYTYLFHFLHAEVQLISGLDYNYSNLLFVLPSVMICTVLTIFLIGRELITPQVGLFASFILICSTYFLSFSINLIPNSFSTIFLLFALFCLLKIYETKNYIQHTILLFLFITYTTLTHILTSLVLLIMLSSFIFFINLRGNENHNLKNIGFMLIAFSIVTFFAVAIYMLFLFSNSISFLISGMNIYQSRPADSLRAIVHVVRPTIEVLHENISLYIFWIISIPGCLYLIQKSNKNIKQIAFSFAALLFFAFFFLIIMTGREIINLRMYYIISFIVCIFAAIFIILTFQSTKKTYAKAGVIVITLLLCIICFISLPANITNALYPTLAGPQVYPFESELSMISSLRTMGSKPLASDTIFEYTESRLGRADITSIDASIYYLDFLHEKDHTIILSDSIFKMTPGKEIFFPEKEVVTYALVSNKFSKIFDVGRARSYIHL